MPEKMHKIIVIDAVHKKLRTAEVLGLQAMQSLVSGLIEKAVTLTNRDEIYVDEEGLFKQYRYGFRIAGAHQPFLGNAFVIGSTGRGNRADVKSTIDELTPLITFFNVDEDDPHVGLEVDNSGRVTGLHRR